MAANRPTAARNCMFVRRSVLVCGFKIPLPRNTMFQAVPGPPLVETYSKAKQTIRECNTLLVQGSPVCRALR